MTLSHTKHPPTFKAIRPFLSLVDTYGRWGGLTLGCPSGMDLVGAPVCIQVPCNNQCCVCIHVSHLKCSGLTVSEAPAPLQPFSRTIHQFIYSATLNARTEQSCWDIQLNDEIRVVGITHHPGVLSMQLKRTGPPLVIPLPMNGLSPLVLSGLSVYLFILHMVRHQ